MTSRSEYTQADADRLAAEAAQVPGTLRPIPDPQAEMERLASQRESADVLLLDEIHQVRVGDDIVFVRVHMTASKRAHWPIDLGARVMDVVRSCHPAVWRGQ